MSSEATYSITLTVAGDPRLARLVRMTAANVGALCSMTCLLYTSPSPRDRG